MRLVLKWQLVRLRAVFVETSQNVMWTWEEIEEFNLKYRASKAQIIKLHQKQIMCSYHVWHARMLDVYVTENPRV